MRGDAGCGHNEKEAKMKKCFMTRLDCQCVSKMSRIADGTMEYTLEQHWLSCGVAVYYVRQTNYHLEHLPGTLKAKAIELERPCVFY